MIDASSTRRATVFDLRPASCVALGNTYKPTASHHRVPGRSGDELNRVDPTSPSGQVAGAEREGGATRQHFRPSRNQSWSASSGQKADSAQPRKNSGSAPKKLRQKNSRAGLSIEGRTETVTSFEKTNLSRLFMRRRNGGGFPLQFGSARNR
jgi:hypothetical protein